MRTDQLVKLIRKRLHEVQFSGYKGKPRALPLCFTQQQSSCNVFVVSFNARLVNVKHGIAHISSAASICMSVRREAASKRSGENLSLNTSLTLHLQQE